MILGVRDGDVGRGRRGGRCGSGSGGVPVRGCGDGTARGRHHDAGGATGGRGVPVAVDGGRTGPTGRVAGVGHQVVRALAQLPVRYRDGGGTREGPRCPPHLRAAQGAGRVRAGPAQLLQGPRPDAGRVGGDRGRPRRDRPRHVGVAARADPAGVPQVAPGRGRHRPTRARRAPRHLAPRRGRRTDPRGAPDRRGWRDRPRGDRGRDPERRGRSRGNVLGAAPRRRAGRRRRGRHRVEGAG